MSATGCRRMYCRRGRASQHGEIPGRPVGRHPGRWTLGSVSRLWLTHCFFPISHSMYREDKTRREIASMIFAQLTAEYAIPPRPMTRTRCSNAVLPSCRNSIFMSCRISSRATWSPSATICFPPNKLPRVARARARSADFHTFFLAKRNWFSLWGQYPGKKISFSRNLQLLLAGVAPVANTVTATPVVRRIAGLERKVEDDNERTT